MTLHNELVELGVLQKLQPGFKACSIEEKRARLNACQQARRRARKEAKASGIPWIPKHIGRPPKYSTLEEALVAKREVYRASKARQTQRIVEAIQNYIKDHADTGQSIDS